MPHWLENPKVRIIGAGLLLACLIAVAANLLRMEPTAEDRVRDTVIHAIQSFEAGDRDRFLDQFAATVNVDTGQYGRFSSRDDVGAAAARAFDQLSYINIRPQNIDVRLDEEEQNAFVMLEFHWTVSGTMYPNQRNRSESRNEDGATERATIGLVQTDGRWVIQEAIWQPGGHR
ncbi:MAG: nuclear transport factor 2 family protein [Candidatus Sumerlaeia bacterium]|nr:nuclear transport factor 2 family protein [Candidatus Sumerlaeia bacterium]